MQIIIRLSSICLSTRPFVFLSSRQFGQSLVTIHVQPATSVGQAVIDKRQEETCESSDAVGLIFRRKLATKIASHWSLHTSHKSETIVKWLTKLLAATVSNSIPFSVNATRNAWANTSSFRRSPSSDLLLPRYIHNGRQCLNAERKF